MKEYPKADRRNRTLSSTFDDQALALGLMALTNDTEAARRLSPVQAEKIAPENVWTAITEHSDDVLEIFLEKNPKLTHTKVAAIPLCSYAVNMGTVRSVQIFDKAGADFSELGPYRLSATHGAQLKKDTPEGAIKLTIALKNLFEKAVNATPQKLRPEDALVAIVEDQPETLATLLERRPNLANATVDNRPLPLYAAAFGTPEIIGVMERNRADFSRRGPDGISALDLALKREDFLKRHVVRMIRDMNVKPAALYEDGPPKTEIYRALRQETLTRTGRRPSVALAFAR